MAVHERETVADHGLLATVRDLLQRGAEPPSSAAVAEAVGVPDVYSGFIERRLELNERRGLVARDEDGRWLLTADGAALAVAGRAGAGRERRRRPDAS